MYIMYNGSACCHSVHNLALPAYLKVLRLKCTKLKFLLVFVKDVNLDPPH